MSMDEITEYLLSGKLDREEVGLGDAYAHLRKLPPTVVEPDETVIEDRPTVPVGIPLNYRAFDTLNDLPTVPVVEGPIQTLDEVCKPCELPAEAPIVNQKAEEILKSAAAKDEPVKAKRGRKTQYDVSGLAVGESIVYNGSLASGRVLASLKGRASMEAGDTPAKYFQATETANDDHVVMVVITRKE